MLFQIIIAIIIGILAGTITGLIPGIHINLISILILTNLNLFSGFTPLILVIFIVSMSITHTFLDFIPSIFLGAPDQDSFLSTLPGHKLLLKGYGYPAVILTLFGSLTGLIIIILLTPLFVYFLPFIYPYFKKIIWLILIITSLFLVSKDKKPKKAFFIFILSGFLGISTLNLSIFQPLFPLLTGLFGASTLIISINQKINLPEQKIIPLKNIKLSKKSFKKSLKAILIASPFTAFLPGLGASQATLIGTEFSKELKEREFLFIIGAVNTIVMGLSFIAFYSINRTRTGSALAVSQLIPEISFINLIIILTTILIAGFLSFILAVCITKKTTQLITKINYTFISLIILSTLIILVILITGFLGLIIFITSTFLGIYTITSNVRRMHLMGCLIIPTIIFLI